MRRVIQWVYDDDTETLTAEVPREDGSGDGTIDRVRPADWDDPAVVANQADLEAKLRTLLTEAAAAIALLQTHRDTQQAAFTTIPQAQTQVRVLQDQVKTQARLQQETMRRLVALARIVVGALAETSNT